MMRVLKFLAGIKPDQTGFSFALPRAIQKGTKLLLHDVYEIIEEAEKEGLVRTMRKNLSGPDGILSAMITEKRRSKVSAREENSDPRVPRLRRKPRQACR